ncbi:hypothetical protein C8Q75DRAFT_110838 [Abortiporus biennis]|nr:hypothetical protein C8Q75DRAFT_110838 [Abortiporus biennis]
MEKGSLREEEPVKAVVVKPWTPIPLRRWFWIPLVCTMAAGAIAFEAALSFSKLNNGWATKGKFTTESGFMHYVYTFPPVAISMILAGLWAWTDIEIRKLQPYVDLAHGNAPPQRSLLLDYTRTHTLLVWTVSVKNQHWIVTMGSLLVLLTFTFQPLSAALFNVQDVLTLDPPQIVQSLAALGLNQNQNFQDLTSFLTAAGYASANALYNIGDPAFIHQGYTIAQFELPAGITNGTVDVNTTAVLSTPGCQGPDPGSLVMNQLPDGTGWQNSASFNGCQFSWSVNKTSVNLFGVAPVSDSSQCPQITNIPQQFRPIQFWFFTYQPTPMASVSMCTPSIQLWEVEATVDLASRNVTQVKQKNQLTQATTTGEGDAEFLGNITGDPLNGRAYNGLFFDLATTDPFVLDRMQAIQLALPASVFQVAESSSGGLTTAFQNNMFADLSSKVYGQYLALVAKTVYFLQTTEPLTIQTSTIHKRLFLSDVAVHLLSIAMLILFFAGTIMQIWHARQRKILSLPHRPGTIASAVAIGAQTNVGSVLAGSKRTKDMREALGGKRFRIDRETLKIVMEGESGYENAVSPTRAEFGGPDLKPVGAGAV